MKPYEYKESNPYFYSIEICIKFCSHLCVNQISAIVKNRDLHEIFEHRLWNVSRNSGSYPCSCTIIFKWAFIVMGCGLSKNHDSSGLPSHVDDWISLLFRIFWTNHKFLWKWFLSFSDSWKIVIRVMIFGIHFESLIWEIKFPVLSLQNRERVIIVGFVFETLGLWTECNPSESENVVGVKWVFHLFFYLFWYRDSRNYYDENTWNFKRS